MQFEMLKKLIPEECNKLRAFIMRDVFILRDEQDIAFFIRRHHAALVRLSDKISDNGKNFQRAGKPCERTADLLFGQITDLLQFLESNYASYRYG